MSITIPADSSAQPNSKSKDSTPPASLPLRTSLLKNLTTQTHLLSTLFTLLTSPLASAHQPSLSNLYTALVESTFELDSLTDQAYAHQVAYAELIRTKEETRGLELELRARLRGLEGGVRELEAVVGEGKKVRESIERSEKDPISSSTLLSTAQNLSAHSSAPLSDLLLPQDKAQYMPWPTEGAMRSGLLFMMGGSMSGVGDLGKIGDEMVDASHKMDVDPQSHVQEVIREVDNRRYDPDAVFQLDLGSDSEDDD